MSEIIYDKTWYLPTFLDNSKSDNQNTGDYSGYLMTRRYVVKEWQNGKRVLKRTMNVEKFGGKNRKEMVQALEKLIKGMRQLPQKADGNNSYTPPEVIRARDTYSRNEWIEKGKREGKIRKKILAPTPLEE